jgi:hypothetical protein
MISAHPTLPIWRKNCKAIVLDDKEMMTYYPVFASGVRDDSHHGHRRSIHCCEKQPGTNFVCSFDQSYEQDKMTYIHTCLFVPQYDPKQKRTVPLQLVTEKESSTPFEQMIAHFICQNCFPISVVESSTFRTLLSSAARIGGAGVIPPFGRKRIASFIMEEAISLTMKTLNTLNGESVSIAIDGGANMETHFIAAILNCPSKLTSPIFIAADIGDSTQSDYALFAATLTTALSKHNIFVGSFVIDGLPQQKRALLDPRLYGPPAPSGMFSSSSILPTRTKSAGAKHFSSLVPPVGLMYPMVVPCLDHMLNLAVSWWLRTEPVALIFREIRKLAGKFHLRTGQKSVISSRAFVGPIPSSSCPLFCQTRFLDVTRLVDWIRENLTIIETTMSFEILGLGIILEPVRAIVETAEADSFLISHSFPVLVDLFQKLHKVSNHPFMQKSRFLQGACSNLRSAIWQISFGCDNGCLFALAYALTAEGACLLREKRFCTILKSLQRDRISSKMRSFEELLPSRFAFSSSISPSTTSQSPPYFSSHSSSSLSSSSSSSSFSDSSPSSSTSFFSSSSTSSSSSSSSSSFSSSPSSPSSSSSSSSFSPSSLSAFSSDSLISEKAKPMRDLKKMKDRLITSFFKNPPEAYGSDTHSELEGNEGIDQECGTDLVPSEDPEAEEDVELIMEVETQYKMQHITKCLRAVYSGFVPNTTEPTTLDWHSICKYQLQLLLECLTINEKEEQSFPPLLTSSSILSFIP